MSTLLFDLDGTLLDVRARHYAVYSGLLGEMGVAPLPRPLYWRRRRAGSPSAELVPGPLRERFRRGWMERIEGREMLAIDRLQPGTKRTLEALSAGHRLVLVTLRHDAEALAWQLGALGLSAHFPLVLTPPPGVTTKVGLWTGDGSSLKVIGDSEADIELATAAGGESICLTHGVRSGRFLRECGADRLADSLSGLLRVL